jgi:hypothetical protein
MALIDLNLINKLETQADFGKSFAESICYNHGKKSTVDPLMFMSCIKRAVQADALWGHLLGIYKESKDFAAGNFQPYIDEHESYRENEEDPGFDPFDQLNDHFESGMISDLPEIIEQYSELLELLAGFGEYREKLDQGFTESFGLIPRYIITDDQGEEVALPRNEVPEDLLNEIDANRQIESITIEYCLDGYNEFYQECRALIDSHRPHETIQECAKAIQLMFAPYKLA